MDDDYVLREPAEDAAAVAAWHEDNRAAWNQGAVRYTEGVDRTVAFLRDGGSNLHPVERELLGDLRAWCGTAIHLQCASGRDTLSLLVEGADRVVGIDISDVHIDNARRTAASLGWGAQWYRCDVLEAPAELDGTADLVYTGRGAINWIADLAAWASVCARLLVPGGVLSVYDGHPFQWLFDEVDGRLELNAIDYFGSAVSSKGWPETYIGDLGLKEADLAPMHEQVHGLGAVVTALLRAGLTLEHLGEHPVDYWDSLPTIPAEVRARLPLTFSVLARKPR
jgi:SAM-dependent methyltransferase